MDYVYEVLIINFIKMELIKFYDLWLEGWFN